MKSTSLVLFVARAVARASRGMPESSLRLAGALAIVAALAGCAESHSQFLDPDCRGDRDGDGAECNVDCNDEDTTVRPGADDYQTFPPCMTVGVGVDNDCDGAIDEGFASCNVFPDSGVIDFDGDGSFTPADCDDSDPSIRPGMPDSEEDDPCVLDPTAGDRRDNDCDGRIDEDFVSCNAFDAGGDFDGDGYASPADCDDTDPYVHPDVPDRPACEGESDTVDNDCDGVVNEDVPKCPMTP